MPAVSLIVPVYKVEAYIGRCARSLFGQTMKDLEYIFIDDCSPDRSIDILQEVLEGFPERKAQVKIHRMPRNGGQAAVRVTGIALATGDYIAHCDSDDSFAPDACEKMYRKAVEEQADIVVCDFLMGNDDIGWKRKIQGSAPGKEVPDLLSGRVMGNLGSRLIRADLLKSAPTPAANFCEDLVLVVSASLRAAKISYLPQTLYRYFYREDSISHFPGKAALLARIDDLLANAGLVLDALHTDGRFSETSAEIVYFKYRCRRDLQPLIHQADIFKRWKSVFPEVNGIFLFTAGIPLKEKFFFVLIYLHLFHPWKMVMGKIRHRL